MRTIEEIQEEMNTVQVRFPSLATLDSTSDVAFFAQMRNMWALLVQIVETSWEAFALKQDAKLAAAKAGGLPWHVTQAKLLQYGDAATVIDGQVGYAVVDAEKQIVAQATVIENAATGRLNLRLAKKGEGGLVALSDEELAAARAYVGKYKYAGVLVDVTSLEADEVKLIANVKVDRQVIAANGTLLTDSNRLPVPEAISKYLAALPYDSVINNTAITDAIQMLPGVKDFTITGSFCRRPVSTTWLAYNGEVVSQAGHGVLSNDSILTYTA